MARILITGGAGFIGSHLALLLASRGHKVSVIDDLSGGNKDNLDVKQVAFYTADCRDASEMETIIGAIKPEIVFHLAANAAENLAQFSPIEITSRNYQAFIAVLTPFIKNHGQRFVFTSSIAVYGEGQTPFLETDDPKPEDLYGITKLAAEQTLKVMSKVHDFEYVIARPHNVYGPKQNMRDPYRNVVTIFINRMRQGLQPEIYGDGNQVRCFSYIDDVVDALSKCGFNNVAGQTFNIGSSEMHTVNELCIAIGKAMGIDPDPVFLPERPQEVKIAVSDHTLSREMLNYVDRTDLEEGIRRTWLWAKELGAVQPVYGRIEIDSPKIPQNWRQK